MYTVSLKTQINTSPAKLLRIWRNPKVLLRYAKSIKKLEVLKRRKDRILTEWQVEFDKVPIKWTQWDVLDTKNGLINFRMEEGEFGRYDGTWQVSVDGAGATTLKLTATIDWGIPKLESHVKRVLQKKSYLIFKSFLKSIKKMRDK